MSNISPVKQLSSDFERWKPTLKSLLPKHLDAERIIKMAVMQYMRSPDLQRCSPVSVIKATVAAAELGLEPGSVRGEAYLVGFGGEAQLIPSYKGLIKLVMQAGEVISISAYCVDETDHFEVELGDEPKIVHRPNIMGRTNKLKAVYAIAKLKNGGFAFDFMLPHDIDAIRVRSRSGNSGPWKTDYNEMAKKTVIKRMLKLLPCASERNELSLALAASYAGETGQVFKTPAVEELEEALGEAPMLDTPKVNMLAEAIKGAK
jgi:recombination protein RecT